VIAGQAGQARVELVVDAADDRLEVLDPGGEQLALGAQVLQLLGRGAARLLEPIVLARVDNAFGDRNLVCSCPPIDSYG